MEMVYMYEGFKKYLNEISSPTHEDFIECNAIYIGSKAETEANLLRRLEH